ncbi:radical SAM protein [Tepidibacter hydrothermalis]|uniref:biotin synthase n=1 Tax=Tepidibacter hydrothermalis TaxID=3036126 RepID=A0ABY8EFF0_9FIRM|nr:radical SAM protein [Tepidibacter hydrothermalis]WFD09463.1 radical SAM protein [Tepidibacter hydrothermalis]
MINLSYGSAIEIGLVNATMDINPTTAYIMIGNGCNNKCAFCSQSIESTSRKDKLSRVLWPKYNKDDILASLLNYRRGNIKRICVQAMGTNEALEMSKEFIRYIKASLEFPISLSAKVETEEEMKNLFDIGVDNVGLAIDAANKELYEKIKGNNFDEKVQFIKKMGNRYKDKISTHIIIGLGENHEDIFDLYKELIDNNVTVSLFAFTPIKGTKLENKKQPRIQDYRKVQLMTYLIKCGYKKEDFEFVNRELKNIKNIKRKENYDIKRGIPFLISGCKDCNRPYYNERPGGTIYNYSRELTDDECLKAISELGMNIEVR